MHDERSDDSLRVEADLFARARDSARKPAIVDGSCEWTYGDLAALTCATAARLKAAALAPGDPVVVFLDKSVESVAALQAVWTAGGIAVPAFEGLRSRQLRHIVEHSGARLLVSTPRKLAGLDAGSAGGAELVEVPRSAPRLSRRDVQVLEAESALPGGRTPAAILYTSGSTGAPKGILLSHANLRAGARIVSGYLGMNSDERVLSVLPFSFDYGLNQLLTTLRVGGTLYLQRSHFPPDICRALARRRITLLAAVRRCGSSSWTGCRPSRRCPSRTCASSRTRAACSRTRSSCATASTCPGRACSSCTGCPRPSARPTCRPS
jgi:acyl-CoA synthetase (AMP-forming)/AMP-acid ligase II